MRTLPRRVFLQDTAALAAGMATISGLRGADAPREDKADNKPVGPNDTLRVAVCGVHGRGMDHVAGWSKLKDVRITTICDVDLNVTGPRGRRSIAATAPSRPSCKTSAACSTTSRSTPSRSPRPTTGTPSPRSGHARPGRTSTSRSRSATTSPKDGGSSKPPGSTTGSFRPARNAAATRESRTPSPFCVRASSGRFTWPRGFVTSREDRSGTSPTVPSPRKSTTTFGSARPPSGRSTPTASTTTGTGIGTTATATSATRASIRWTWPAGDWARTSCPRP